MYALLVLNTDIIAVYAAFSLLVEYRAYRCKFYIIFTFKDHLFML